MTTSTAPQHPGAFIRARVIPSGMSIKDAAERLGVGRPALSNLLNGKASLSADMAVRLEKAFGANRQELTDLQADFDRHEQQAGEKDVAVRAYVPTFLAIKARQIHEWAEDNLDARQLLPVLLRKLVYSTGHDLRQLDFPGYDNAERKGWDGLTDSGAATPWIAEGRSCWEFGTSKDSRAKAEKDYAARTVSVPPSERTNTTFVFVTPRNWPGKTQWVKEKSAAGEWKAVRVYDASDLEQWLEESIPAQIWLAEKLSLPTNGFETIDSCWHRWTAASDPEMSRDIFGPSIEAYRGTFKSWLDKPSERPFIVAADSRDEALAFLSCLFRDSEIATGTKDLAVVFESADTLRMLAPSSSPFVPIVHTEAAERELGTIYRRLHCIVVRPRNTVESEPDVALDLLSHDAFQKALAVMGIKDDNVDRLARESGRSPTILRRRLSKIDAIRTPKWAGDVEIARSLIPIALVGAWHANSSADCEVVSVLAGRPYQEVEEAATRLLQFDDCPVWSAGQYRGVASKIDALFAINKSVTERDIAEFLVLAEYVLSESDPALDLPEDQRWAAGLYGKLRDHSTALRDGICETLVILSVHGNNLFRDRLGVDVESRVSLLIRRLLTPLTLEKLLSHDDDLARYAEAAPDEFLRLLEADLKAPKPIVLGLLKPADTGIFGGCPRTGLLWALECLAWKPQNLSRVSNILAELSRTKIEDNWINKPIASLKAIYRSWMPQTASSLEERGKALEMLTKRFPDIGWKICIDQFELGSRVGHDSYRPRWRSDASGAGQVVTIGEMRRFMRKALDLTIGWQTHDEGTLGDLVECLQGMPVEDQIRIWKLVETWSVTVGDDHTKAKLRERIRRSALTRRGRRDLDQPTRDRAREAYAALAPHDPVARHAWLFATQWVDESADEIEERDFNYERRGARIDRQRSAALKDVWVAQGVDGIKALLSRSEAPHVVGRYVAPCLKGVNASAAFLQQSIGLAGDLAKKADGCMQGVLSTLDVKKLDSVLSTTVKGLDTNQIARLFRCAPFGEVTWRLLDSYDEEIRKQYWQEVFPYWNRHSDAELIEIIDRLLEAKRPRAAFHAVHLDWDKIETSRLKKLLLAVATTGAEPLPIFQISAHDISDALQSLNGRTGVSVDDMAQLEFLFVRALDHSEHGIPNLERQISTSPAIYMQAVAFAYKRDDSNEDPPEWRIDDPQHRTNVATAAHQLLDSIKRIPGTQDDRIVSAPALTAWLNEVRQLCALYARATIGDHVVGQLLSRAPPSESGIWPCIPVCEAMETVASEDIADGFVIGTLNSRGVHSRGEGGAQERDLAAKYRGWSKQLSFDYPYVSSVLERVAVSYDRQAESQDSEAIVRKRLR